MLRERFNVIDFAKYFNKNHELRFEHHGVRHGVPLFASLAVFFTLSLREHDLYLRPLVAAIIIVFAAGFGNEKVLDYV